MTFYDRTLEDLHCPGCHVRQPLYSRLLTNPFQMVCAIESFAKKHAACSKAIEARAQWERLFTVTKAVPRKPRRASQRSLPQGKALQLLEGGLSLPVSS